jgi:hypothetical protein
VNVVAPLSRERLVRMAQDRAKVYGVSFDPTFLSDLTDHLLQIHTLTQIPQIGFLSAYEQALARLWQEKQDTASISSTQDSPALHLDAWAESVFLALNEQDQLLARHLFLQLVQLEKRQEDIPDVRRFLPINTLCQHEQERDLVYRLVEQGLLAIFRDGSTHEEIVSIAQSALLATWLRLNAWLEEKSHFEQWYTSFAQRLATTSALSPADLQEAILWLERYPDRFAPGMRDVLQSNQQRLLREQEAEEKSRQLVKQQTITKARQLANQVEVLYNQAPGQMEEAISVALEALRLVHCPETDQCIRNCLDRLPKPLTVYRVEASFVAVDVNAICGMAAFARADGIIFLLHLSTGQWRHIDCQASVQNRQGLLRLRGALQIFSLVSMKKS